MTPTITGFSPNLGPVGQWTYIFGTDFVPGDTTIYFGDIQGSDVMFYDTNQIGFTMPLESTGSNFIKVVTPEGEVTSLDQFTIGTPITPPTVTSYQLHPTELDWMYVNGENFVCNQTSISYNSGSVVDGYTNIESFVYSPISLGFKIINPTDVVSSITVTTPYGSGSINP